jgi:uncharacterized protein YjbI with pentapeptide repeats
MADPEHIAVVKQGREAIDLWREQRSDQYSSLYPMRFKLDKADLRGVDLQEADLSGADLSEADLSGTNLCGANLSPADLNGADLRGAMLTGANLRGATLRKADLYEANLSKVDLRNADLQEATFQAADLSGANLCEADLSGTNLYGANLSGADLGRTKLSGADLRGAQLGGAQLDGADLCEALLHDAKLCGAMLMAADLSGAQLNGSDLNGADLRGANLSEANLIGADLSRAWFEETNLAGTIMRHVRGAYWARELETTRFTSHVNRSAGTPIPPEHASPEMMPSRFSTDHTNDALYFETCIRSRPERWLDWECLRIVGRLPLFGASYTALILIPIIFYGLALYNNQVELVRRWAMEVRRWAEQTPTLPVDSARLLEWLMDLVLWHLHPHPVPQQSFWLLFSTILLAVGSTLYTFFCPSRVKEFSRDQWCDQLGRSLVHYWPLAWKHRIIRLVCAGCYIVTTNFTNC